MNAQEVQADQTGSNQDPTHLIKQVAARRAAQAVAQCGPQAEESPAQRIIREAKEQLDLAYPGYEISVHANLLKKDKTARITAKAMTN